MRSPRRSPPRASSLTVARPDPRPRARVRTARPRPASPQLRRARRTTRTPRPPASPRRARSFRRRSGRSTLTASMSARSCAIQSLATMPPSILSICPVGAVGGERRLQVVRLVRHRLQRGAHDMRPARRRSSAPMIVARASGSHQGAPRPVSAGTRYTPPLSSTMRASASVSRRGADQPESSRAAT